MSMLQVLPAPKSMPMLSNNKSSKAFSKLSKIDSIRMLLPPPPMQAQQELTPKPRLLLVPKEMLPLKEMLLLKMRAPSKVKPLPMEPLLQGVKRPPEKLLPERRSLPRVKVHKPKAVLLPKPVQVGMLPQLPGKVLRV